MLKAHVTPETLPPKRQTDTNDQCKRSFVNNVHTSSKGARLSFNDKETVVFRLSDPAFWISQKILTQCHKQEFRSTEKPEICMLYNARPKT
jgi:hypothetical protein